MDWIRAAWFGNDWVTLVLATPFLVVGLVRGARGSVRGLLLWVGMIGYAVYNYAFYLFGATLNAFFPLYIVTLVVEVVALILLVIQVDADAIARSFRPATPVRLIGGSLVVVGMGLASVWTAMWAAYVFAGRPTPVEPDAFRLVAHSTSR